jgi:hypothetical protein
MGWFSKPTQEDFQDVLSVEIIRADLDGMKKCVARGARLDMPLIINKERLQTALHACVRRGFTEGVEYCLSFQPKIESEPPFLLMTSISYGGIDVTRLLINYGFDIHYTNKRGETPLHEAAGRDAEMSARLLLKAGADPRAIDHFDRTPVDAAESRGYHRLADYIRSYGQKALPAPAPDRWELTAPDEVSHISLRPTLGYKLTEIFNFGLHTYRGLSLNLETGQETQVFSGFGDFAVDDTALEKAKQKLVDLGGDAPPASRHLSKPAFKLPEAGGMQ